MVLLGWLVCRNKIAPMFLYNKVLKRTIVRKSTRNFPEIFYAFPYSRAARLGGVQTRGFPDLDSSVPICPLFVLLGTFPVFGGAFLSFFRDFPDLLFLGLSLQGTFLKGSATQSGPSQ